MTGPNVAIVDWSAASAPSPLAPSADAVWIGACGPDGTTTAYFRTRAEAERHLGALIAEGEWLVGFDFPMGYPDGFARRLTGQDSARAVWHWLDGQIEDGPANRNNRFAVAAAINCQLGGRRGPGPFWGRPAKLDLHDLPARKQVDYPALGLSERRRVEQVVRSAQPVWKLFTTGSVGSQSLMGLPMIARLTRQPDVSVWPFDPPSRVVLAEVYPSLLRAEVARSGDPIRDRAQVTLLAQALWEAARAGQLDPLMATPAEVRRAEGWILGAGQEALLRQALTEGRAWA